MQENEKFSSEMGFVIDDTGYLTTTTRKYEQRKPSRRQDPSRLAAYIPGQVIEVRVKVGEQVTRGMPLVVVEAMKMKSELTAGCDGSIKAIHVEPGQLVCKDQLLVEIE